MKSRPIFTRIALFVSTVLIGSVQAATIKVFSEADTNNSPDCTLRQAIEAANTNTAVGSCLAGESGKDDIIFAENVRSVTLSGEEISITEPINIDGKFRSYNEEDFSRVRIDANEQSRIFRFASRANDSEISNFILTKGKAPSGAAIITNAMLTINNVEFSKNAAAQYGGAIYSFAPVALSGNRFTENIATQHGGAVYLRLDDAQDIGVYNNWFSRNQARDGGALYVQANASIDVDSENNLYLANRATRNGALIYAIATQNGDLTINMDRNEATSNSARESGVIYVSASGNRTGNGQITLNIRNSTLAANNAQQGGVIYGTTDVEEHPNRRQEVTALLKLNIENSTLYDNGTQAAILYADAKANDILNRYTSHIDVTLTNTTWANNRIPDNAQLFSFNGVHDMTFADVDVKMDSNIILGSSGVTNKKNCTETSRSVKITGTNNLLDDASCGAIGNTATQLDNILAKDADGRLVTDRECLFSHCYNTLVLRPMPNPAIDGGSTSTANDQRGVPTQGRRRDIGAYELGEVVFVKVNPSAGGRINANASPAPIAGQINNCTTKRPSACRAAYTKDASASLILTATPNTTTPATTFLQWGSVISISCFSKKSRVSITLNTSHFCRPNFDVAGVITVTSAQDDGTDCTLREAINLGNRRDTNELNGCTRQPYPSGQEADQDTILFDHTVFATPKTITLKEEEIRSLSVIMDTESKIVTVDAQQKSGIFTFSGRHSSSLTGLTLINGHAKKGGAVYARNGLTLTDMTFANNKAESAGGAVHAKIIPFAADIRAQEKPWLDSRSTYQVNAKTPHVKSLSSEKKAHQATYRATPIPMPLSIHNSTFVRNTVTNGDGGAISTGGEGNVMIGNSTLVENTASDKGGAVFFDTFGNHTLTLNSNILLGNTATSDKNCFLNGRASLDTTASTHNLMDDGCGLTNAVNDNQIAATHTVTDVFETDSADKVKLDDNCENAPCMHTAKLIRSLAAGNPAINTGTAPRTLTTDQRGKPRSMGGAVDIGAHESDEIRLTITPTASGSVTSSTPSVTGGIAACQVGTERLCRALYKNGATVSITATADSGYTFKTWRGCTVRNNQLVMNTDQTCEAIFESRTGGTSGLFQDSFE